MSQEKLSKSLKKVLQKKPNDENAEALDNLGIKPTSNSDVIAAALFERAAKGEVSAIKEICNLVGDDERGSGNLSKLYKALGQEDK